MTTDVKVTAYKLLWGFTIAMIFTPRSPDPVPVSEHTATSCHLTPWKVSSFPKRQNGLINI